MLSWRYKTKWNESKTNTAASRPASWVMPIKFFGEFVIIKRWLTLDDASLIFFLSGPVKVKDITTLPRFLFRLVNDKGISTSLRKFKKCMQFSLVLFFLLRYVVHQWLLYKRLSSWLWKNALSFTLVKTFNYKTAHRRRKQFRSIGKAASKRTRKRQHRDWILNASKYSKIASAVDTIVSFTDLYMSNYQFKTGCKLKTIAKLDWWIKKINFLVIREGTDSSHAKQHGQSWVNEALTCASGFKGKSSYLTKRRREKNLSILALITVQVPKTRTTF